MEREQTVESKESLTGKVKDSLKYHVVDSTALMAVSTPVFAAF